MENNAKIRNYLRPLLREALEGSLPFEKTNCSQFNRKQYENHIDKELLEFTRNFKKIALENNHPHVRYYLCNALEELKETIGSGSIISAGWEEFSF